MYFIYKIQNLINAKCYIGSSNTDRGLFTRWLEHQQNARLSKRLAYNYPLSKAIRKYGVDNFSYEIIIKDIPTVKEKVALEKLMIQQYNSLVTGWGYNQTENTDYSFDDPLVREKHATKVCAISLIDNSQIIFPSVAEAARQLQVDRRSIHACIKGDTRHSVVKNYVIRKYDKSTETIIENSIPISEAGRYKLIEINGQKKSLTEWCKIYNISKQSVYKRMKTKGLTVKEAITLPKRR